jgi:hypothetical protein
MSRPTHNLLTLRRVLQQELALGKRMIALAETMTDLLVNQETERLAALEAEQRECREQHEALEQARIAVTRSLAGALGLEGLPTLSELLPLLPAREQEPLKRLRSELLTMQETLARLNARNRRLLDNALEYVRFSLELLTSAALQPARYGTNLASVAAPTFYIDSKA